MSYFLPSFFQKRLLRYALSRLEFVDTDALDLDSLGITWGQRSTFELRDIGLRLEKLSSTLKLPPNFELSKARVSHVRVTIPADIYNSGIIVEAEGVELNLKLLPDRSEQHGHGRGYTGTKSNSYQDGSLAGDDVDFSSHEQGSILPSTADLAQSYLDSEPREKTRELEEALSSQSQNVHQQSDIMSDDNEEDPGLGLHDGVSLPSFVASFLKGVGDRLELKVEDVLVKVEMEVEKDAQTSGSLEPITGVLAIESVAIDGVASESLEDKNQKAGKRLINVSQIQAMLVSDEDLFSNYSRFNNNLSTSSSTAAHSEKSHSSAGIPSPEAPPSSGSSSTHAMAQSTIFNPLSSSLDDQQQHGHAEEFRSLHASVSSNGGRFSDAESDYGYSSKEYPRDGGRQLFDSEEGQLDESIHSGSFGNTRSTTPPHHLKYISDDGEGETPRPYSPPSPSSSTRSQAFYSMVEDRSSPGSSRVLGDSIGSHITNYYETDSPFLDQPSSSFRMYSEGTPNYEPVTPETSNVAIPKPDELSESTLFTHDQAKSMYMSVMSNRYTDTSSDLNMPGGWGSPEPTGTIGDPEQALDTQIPGQASDHRRTPTLSDCVEPETGSDSNFKSNKKASYGAAGSNEASNSSMQDTDVFKSVLEIDRIAVWIPSINNVKPEEEHLEPPYKPSQHLDESTFSLADSTVHGSLDPKSRLHGRVRRDLFSPLTNSSQVSTPGSLRNNEGIEGNVLNAAQIKQAVEVDVSSVNVKFDLACGWLLLKMAQNVIAGLDLDAEDEASEPPNDVPAFVPVDLNLTNFSAKLLEQVPSQALSYLKTKTVLNESPGISSEGAILHALLTDVEFQTWSAGHKVKSGFSVGRFTLCHMSKQMISFHDSVNMRVHTRDISLIATKTSESTRVDLRTLPIHLVLNLRQLDETIGWFGGLSTLIELGSSITSAATVKGAKPEPGYRPRVVHFEQAPSQNPTTSDTKRHSWKVNSTINGVIVHLIGEKSRIKLDASTVRFVNRSEGIGIQTRQILVTGPHFGHHDSVDPKPAASITIEGIRVDYLYSPMEKDLDRLLNLLTPSKDKYADDDDIMLDTLFRQRRKGAVIRLEAKRVSASILSLHSLHQLTPLIDETAKLSKVAKYFPEDDKPGILILGHIQELTIRVNIGGQVGELSLTSHTVEAGYVSLPSLIAAQVVEITILRNGKEELLAQAVPRPGGKDIKTPVPMIMARYIAGEMDPTIKIKLFNTRAEYTVSSITAFLGIAKDEITAERIAANMAQSVVNLAEIPGQHVADLDSSILSSMGSQNPTSPWKVTVTLKDCLIGLSPLKSSAKALVVFTDAKLFGTLHEIEPSEATLEVQRACMMIIDDTDYVAQDSTRQTHKSYPTTQVEALQNMGYVSVCHASSASVAVKIMQLDSSGEKSLDVELRDDLLILETCADSTQTLISIMSGLAPPSPPDNALKYRTEVVPLQEMLNSITGDGFTMGGLGSVDSSSKTVSKGDSKEDTNDEADDLEYVSDFYPYYPAVGKHRSDGDGKNKYLTSSLHSNAEVSSDILALDFQDDHFAKKSAVEGTAHRWDSSRNTYSLSNEVRLHGSPLRVRVRDVHVIWNLYDGFDWQRTRDKITATVKDVQTRATDQNSKAGDKRASREPENGKEAVVGDFLFNSVYIDIPSNREPGELSRAVNQDINDQTSSSGSFATATTLTGRSNQAPLGRRERLRLTRSKHHKMTIELTGIAADLVVFPQELEETQSSLDVRVHDIEIFDHIPTSTWKKFATYMHDAGEREVGTSMLHLEAQNVKPVAELAASEIVLKATVLPLRLHVDHDALDFMSRFFEFKNESELTSPPSPGDIPFLQRVEVNAIPIRLDFKPKRVDYKGLRSGRTTEFMNLVALDEVDMVLRRVIIYGVSGFDKLGNTLNDIWMPDIKSNQLASVLAGLAPVKSLVNIGSGFKDLVAIPIREYKKDGRVVRSVQKGALSFATTTTNEFVKLSAKIAIGTQGVLQGAEGFLNRPTAGQSSRPASFGSDGRYEDDTSDEEEQKKISLYADQPVGVMQGLRGGYSNMERDLKLARDAVVAVPAELLESKNATEAAGSLMRRGPTIVLRPIIGAAGALGLALLGAGNTLDPANKRRADEKYTPY